MIIKASFQASWWLQEQERKVNHLTCLLKRLVAHTHHIMYACVFNAFYDQSLHISHLHIVVVFFGIGHLWSSGFQHGDNSDRRICSQKFFGDGIIRSVPVDFDRLYVYLRHAFAGFVFSVQKKLAACAKRHADQNIHLFLFIQRFYFVALPNYKIRYFFIRQHTIRGV